MRLLLLIPVALLGFTSAGAFASTHKAHDTAAVGRITSLSPTSISVRHTHPLSCTIGVNSPDTSMFKVAELVRIDCVDNALVEISSRGHSHKTSLTGTILSRNGHSITIDGEHDVTCKLDTGSPGLLGHKIGEAVTVNCEHGVLVNLSHTDTTPSTSGISGAVTALSATSITVHDGDRDVTCSIASTSPSLGDLKIGDHIKIGCVNSVLIYLGRVDGPPATTTTTTSTTSTTTTTTTTTNSGTYTNLNGAISALGSTSITVHDGDHNLTCTIGSSSPSTSGFAVGNFVRMYCLNGALYYLAHNDTTTTTTTTTPTTTTTAGTYTNLNGTITVLGSSITAHNSEHDLTCTIGSSSPSTSGFAVGSAVRMYCLNGVLIYLAHNDETTTTTTTTPTTTTTATTTTTTTTPQYTSVTGPISALSSGSITVHGEIDLTCSIGSGTPSASGFAVGNQVKMYCLSGALYAIAHQ